MRRWLGRRRPRTVVIYTRDGCGLCRQAERIVADEASGHEIRHVDIDADEALLRRYHVRVPVVTIDGREVAEGLVAPGQIRRALRRG